MKIPIGRALHIIIKRELFYEIRSRQRLLIVFLFAVLSTFVFSFALELNRILRQEVIVGVFWATVLLASLLGFERQSSDGYRHEMSEALRLTPLSRYSILFGQIFANWMITLILALFTLLVQSWLFDANLLNFQYIIIAVLGSLGIVTIGTTLSVMISQIRVRVGVLGVLFIPLSLPILISCVRYSLAAQNDLAESQVWILLLGIQDLVLIILASWLYPYLLDE